MGPTYQVRLEESEVPALQTLISWTHCVKVLLHAASSALPHSGMHQSQCPWREPK